ncbi:MAG: GMC family oxidoreductase N-terminal domain-containing protein [Acidobacteriota bacterium]
MSETFDVIICGAGSAGGFMAGEIAGHGSVLILDAGPYFPGEPIPGVGDPERRRLSTQVNLGTWLPADKSSNRGDLFFTYPMYMDRSNPFSATAQREARLVGGGSAINVGAWLRPRIIDFEGFQEETGVQGWTKEDFEPHFQRAERILHVHRDSREFWNKASVLYEQIALSLGIPVFEEASNRHRCIFCGQRLNAGMPCKYDALMSTAITQIPKAIAAGAILRDNARVIRVEIVDGTATGVTYERHGEVTTVHADKLVVVSAGAIGTPLILRDSGLHLLNPNVGRHLRAHPGVPIDVLLPGDDWDSDRGYQWNLYHHVMDGNGEPLDAVVHASAGFPASTPWVAAAFKIGLFGRPYKDVMRRFRHLAGAFIFEMKPDTSGSISGGVDHPVIHYPVTTPTGVLEPKTMNDILAALRQVWEIYRRMGAYTAFPNPEDPEPILKQQVSLFVTTSGALHPQGTCRAGADPSNSVVDENLLSWDIQNLMCCDASVIPHHISSNPNAMIMAVASRAADFVNTQLLGAGPEATAEAELANPRERRTLHVR